MGSMIIIIISRPYYYNQATDKVENWDSGIQIFGGQAVYDNMKLLSHPIKKIDKQTRIINHSYNNRTLLNSNKGLLSLLLDKVDSSDGYFDLVPFR